jgi:hypothetical protein
MRSAKRGQDLRKIRLSKCYTVQECAGLLSVSISTIRAWIRLGLPIVDAGKPLLIAGDALKSWLINRKAARKRKCQPDELYCCSCKQPRKAKIGTVMIVPRNSKTLFIRANCADCNAKMNQVGSLAYLSEILAVFGLETLAQVNLAGCENSNVNQHLEKETIK